MSRPLGVFDSGVGGLTVVGEILSRNPDESILYLADQAHVPYGGRPLPEIREFATQISRFMVREGCRAVIMACNISSAVALASVREMLAPLPVFGMIEPASRRAVAVSSGPIGVLATLGTVNSGAYTAQVHSLDSTATVVEVACPRFVPLIEAGELETPEALDACREYLTPLAHAGCRTIILGCTHYPFLLPALHQVAGDLVGGDVQFIDPAVELMDALDSVSVGRPARSEIVLTTTGDTAAFARQVDRFLPSDRYRVEQTAWAGERVERARQLAAV